MKRVLGIDFGDKRIGVAISDSLGITAQGLAVIENTGRKAAFESIAKMIDEHGIDTVVLGLPRNMNGSYGPMAEKIQRLGRRISQQLGVYVVYQDERMTTIIAEQALIEGNMRREDRKKVVDRVAAQVILQSYLDRKKV